jgi:hypothetical protein
MTSRTDDRSGCAPLAFLAMLFAVPAIAGPLETYLALGDSIAFGETDITPVSFGDRVTLGSMLTSSRRRTQAFVRTSSIWRFLPKPKSTKLVHLKLHFGRGCPPARRGLLRYEREVNLPA